MHDIDHIRPNATPPAARRADCVLGRERTRPRAGFTLLELALVLAIVAVVSGVVVLSYGSALAGYRADAAAERLSMDIGLTQAKARGMSQSRVIIFSAGKNAYGILDEPGATSPTSPYVVYLSADPYQATLSSASFGGAGQLVFDGYGQPSSGGTVVVTVGAQSRTLTVDSTTGKVTIAR